MRAPIQQQGAEPRRRRVRFLLHPHRDESFQGFAARTVAWNFLPSSEALLKEASSGLGPSPRPGRTRPSEPHLDALSFCLGAPRADVERMLHISTAVASPYVNFFGTVIRLARLDPTRRCVSPASLRVAAYHRANWAIRSLPFCPASWDFLVSQCVACGRTLGWRRTRGIDFCEHCGLDLKTIEPDQVPIALRTELSALAALLSPIEDVREAARQQFTANVRVLEPGLIFELAIALGRAAASRPRAEVDPVRQLGLPEMASGVRLLRNYRHELPKLLRAQGQNVQRSSFFIHLARLKALRDSELWSVLNEITDEIEPIRHGPQRLKLQRETQDLLTLGQAARRLSIDNSGLRTLIDAGALPLAKGRGQLRRHQWIKPDDVEHLRMRLRDRLSAATFSRHFGLPLAGVRQLITIGLVGEFDDPIVSRVYQGLQLSRTSALAFLDDLGSAVEAPRLDRRPLPLFDLFHGIGGQEKPWAAILNAAIAGDLPGGLIKDPEAPLKIANLCVSAEVARDVVRGTRPDLLHAPASLTAADEVLALSRQEVETYLNCFPRDVSWLISAGRLHSTSPVQRFSREAVAALGRELITTREINWRWQLAPEGLESLLASGGVRRAAGPFWPRKLVEEHFTSNGRQNDPEYFEVTEAAMTPMVEPRRRRA